MISGSRPHLEAASPPTQQRPLTGFTLVEAVCALAILGVALAATLTMNVTYVKSERFAEERRLALQAAVEKIEEMRRKVASGVSLDVIYDQYAPMYNQATDAANMPLAAFKVPGLVTDSNDAVRREYVGTVSLIVDETPNEMDYGIDYGVSPTVLKFGADINGNRYYSDTYPTVVSPFPMDINGNGTTTDNPMTEGFYVLPVVITVHWRGVYGNQRVDMFAILFPDKRI